MITSWLGINPFSTAQLVVLLSAFFTLGFVLLDEHLRSLLRNHWRFLCIALILVIFWRYPFQGSSFYGLEYEDSYVYAVAARADVQQPNSSELGSRYLTSTCLVGSLENCDVSETYSGHYIGWPAVIRLASHAFRFSPQLLTYLGIAASCVAAIAIFLICCLSTDDSTASFMACLVFATTPAFAVYGISSYAEPSSNACIAVVLLCFIALLHPERRTSFTYTIALLAFFCTMLLAVLIKRENITLPLDLCVAAVIWILIRRNRLEPNRKFIYFVVVISVIAFVLSLVEFAPASTLASETREFGSFPFSLANLRVLTPAYLRAFTSFRWYSFTFFLVVVGLWLTIRYKTVGSVTVSLFVCYFFLYVSHVTSYYQIHTGSVVPYQTLRFSMNLMTLWSLLAGVGCATVLRLIPRFSGYRALVASLLLIYGVMTYAFTVSLRDEVHADEVGARVKPALHATAVAVGSETTVTYVVTLEPLVVQLFASPRVRVLSLYAADKQLFRELHNKYSTVALIYLRQDQYRNYITNTRYANAIKCLDSIPHRTLTDKDGYSISVYTPSAGALDRSDCN